MRRPKWGGGGGWGGGEVNSNVNGMHEKSAYDPKKEKQRRNLARQFFVSKFHNVNE